MAFQQNNNPNQRRKDNYFKRELQQYRSTTPINFMADKDAKRKLKDCKAICRDICAGNISPTEDGEYFLQPELIDQLVNFTYSKLWYYTTISNALTEKYQYLKATLGPGANDPRISYIIDELLKSTKAYDVLYTGFSGIKSQGFPKEWLTTMMSQLPKGHYVNNI